MSGENIEKYNRVRLTPTDEYLANPHKGCCTFQHFNGDQLFPDVSWSEAGPEEFPDPEMIETILPNEPKPKWPLAPVDGYLPSTVSYCRWFWQTFEKEEGVYDFTLIDKALSVAEERGQTLAVRLMAYGSLKQPQCPDWYSAQYAMEESHTHDGGAHVVPDHNSDDYYEKWGGLIREFAKRYDADDRLESIDVAFIGPWGEGFGECSDEQIEKFVALWTDSFKETPCISLLEGFQLEAGAERGTGWRCDCFGDSMFLGSPNVPVKSSWNHMFDSYPQSISQPGVKNAWQNAPVHFETCHVPMRWFYKGGDIDFIIQQGLKYHGTYFMPKSCRLPEQWMDKLADFCRKLGYRFVLRQAMFEQSVKASGEMEFSTWIENVGIAPIYKKYDFALRIRQDENVYIHRFEEEDIRTWLPGDICLEKVIPLPEWLRPGVCDLSAGIIDKNNDAKVRFAVKERYSDRWSPLGKLEVTA